MFYRKKQLRAAELRVAGKQVDEIADELGISVDKAKEWTEDAGDQK